MPAHSTSSGRAQKKTADSAVKKKKDQATDAPVEELSDAELLKKRKEEAKVKKEEAKTEKKAAKDERVHSAHHGKEKKAIEQKRNPLKIHSKKWRAAAEKLDKLKNYPLAEAIRLAQETATTKFDSSVEIHVGLGIDVKKSDQVVRSTVALPHGTGKALRVIAFVVAEKAKEAKTAGAVEAGEDDLIEKIAKGWLDFDVAVATPEMMKKIGKIAKTLGQKGLMPNPKAGTVTADFTSAIAEIQKGKVEFRTDKFGILHNTVGKVSFTAAKLEENIRAYLAAVKEVQPKGVKGTYLEAVSLATTMGPGVKVDVSDATQK